MKNKLMMRVLGVLATVVLGVITINAVVFAMGQEAIPGHLKLKAAKENILGSKQIDWIEETANGPVNHGKIVKYAYNSGVKIGTTPDNEVVKQAQNKNLNISAELVDKRTKNSRTFSTNDPNTFVSEFISGVPQFYEDQNGEWWQTEYATTTPEAFDGQTSLNFTDKLLSSLFGRSALAATSTFYPDADTESTSVDGYISYNTSTDWATTRNATSGAFVNDNWVDIPVHSGKEANYRIARGFTLFDTSAIPDGDTIDSATLSYYETNGNADSESSPYYIVSATPATNTALVVEDYDQVGSTSFGNVSVGSANTYLDVTLNADGLAQIDKTGVTKFAARANYDFNDITPIYSVSGLNFKSADETGTDKDPKLVVVHHNEPPAISNIQASNIAETSATISWTTDKLANSKVSYGTTTGAYTLNGFDAASTTSHSIDLSSLTASTTYYYVVVSTDVAVATSSEQTFSTLTPLKLKVRKAVSESLSNSTTLQDDDELALTPSVSKTYIITGAVFASSTSSQPDIKISLDVPNDATMDVGYLALQGTASSHGELLHGGQQSARIAIGANNATVIHLSGTIKMGSTSGPMRLRWAQNTSNAAATVVLRGSYLKAEEI